MKCCLEADGGTSGTLYRTKGGVYSALCLKRGIYPLSLLLPSEPEQQG